MMPDVSVFSLNPGSKQSLTDLLHSPGVSTQKTYTRVCKRKIPEKVETARKLFSSFNSFRMDRFNVLSTKTLHLTNEPHTVCDIPYKL